MAMAPPRGVYRPAVCCLVLYVVVLQMRLDFTVGVFDAEAAEAPQLENADIARGGGKVTIWDVGQLAEKEESQQKNADNLRGVKMLTEVAAELAREGPKPNDKGKGDVPRQPLYVPDFLKDGEFRNEFWDKVHPRFDPVKDGLTKDEMDVFRNWAHYKAQKKHSMIHTLSWGLADFLLFWTLNYESIAPWVFLAAPVAAGIAWYVRYRQQESAKKRLQHMVKTRIHDIVQRRRAGLATPNWSLNESWIEDHYGWGADKISNSVH